VTSPATALIVAAGSGDRLGAGPKAFVTLAGEALLVHAVRAFTGLVDDIVVVVAAADVERAVEVLERADLRPSGVCAGGRTRQESVARGLRACRDRPGRIAVHDAARPLASRELIGRTLAALEPGWAAVAPGLPVVDTLKLVEDSHVVRTVDRTGLWGVQTPQVFDRATLARVHADADAVGGATDDLALVEAAGGKVRLIPGERRNFKVTYPEDLVMAEALLAAGRPRRA
jgi:2-C-methyl-D-erythritol 4-phosphate cytidylyltransferase